MRKLLIILLAVCMVAPVGAQTTRKKTRTTQATSQTKKKTTSTKKTTKKKTATKSKSKNQQPTIDGLKNKRKEIQQNIRKQEKALSENKADVQQRLKKLVELTGSIGEHKKNIALIEGDIASIDGQIATLQQQLSTLNDQLEERRQRYIKSVRYAARKHSLQDKLMFIFSANNFAQMYRRSRFVREYAAYQRQQGEAIERKQAQVRVKRDQLDQAKLNKNTLLNKGRREHHELENKQAEQQRMVDDLKKQQRTIQNVIAQQRREDASLNAQIDRLVAEEIARAKAAAEAEAKAKAAAEAKRRKQELERRRAAAEEARRENARLIAEARQRERELQARAEASKRGNQEQQQQAKQQAREAQADREAIERKAKADEQRHSNEIKAAERDAHNVEMFSAVDRKLSGGFEQNKGRLPMPITGSYRIVSHFGQYNVDGMKNVTLDNKGINILGTAGCQARSIYNGEVSRIANYGGQYIVLVRHGAYISVYCNLSSVNVHKGQKVSARQSLGTVGRDNILQFQLRRETAKLNPERWIAH